MLDDGLNSILFLVQIGFLQVTVWDVLDILIVGYLIYRIYKLLRGSIAFNIFIGVITLMVFYWVVNLLNMDLLSALLDQFVEIGVLSIIIIFQPEVRRFLLFLGDSTMRQRSNFWSRLLDRNPQGSSELKKKHIQALKAALLRMSRTKTGALIVLTNNVNLESISNTGIRLDADVSQQLIESIFNKESPLHDGAVLIFDHKIYAASCILPVSDNPNLPTSAGLRHRAAVGITERARVACFIVSEENGGISFAYEGSLYRKLSEEKLTELLNEHYL